MRRFLPLLFLCAPVLMAQGGTDPKPHAADYPVQAKAGSAGLGAEYMVHSFAGRRQTFIAGDFLVVEVAVFPARGEALDVSAGNFTLRINRAKRALFAQSPGMVAASLKYPDWERRSTLEVGGGVGDAGVILGRPAPAERFPGDPSGRNRLPAPPRAPAPESPGGMERPEPARAEDVVVETALPEGPARGPVSGFLYFPYKGKIKSIKSLELLYAGPAGSVALRLL